VLEAQNSYLDSFKGSGMRTILCAIIIAAAAIAGCGRQPVASGESQPLTAERAAQVVTDVRAFMQTVAHDVTQDGPSAWRKHFADVPAFFMVADGYLVYADSDAATAGIPNLERRIKHIELSWNYDQHLESVMSGRVVAQKEVRVDPLTPNLAVVATPWREAIVNSTGENMVTTGYFTGVAEFKNGRWQFRDAHWSIAPIIPDP
jgi:hypothetical protein